MSKSSKVSKIKLHDNAKCDITEEKERCENAATKIFNFNNGTFLRVCTSHFTCLNNIKKQGEFRYESKSI